MKIVMHDAARCANSGRCAALAPDVFAPRGTPDRLRRIVVDGDDEDYLRRIVAPLCPARAIGLVDPRLPREA
ncbi:MULTISPECIES: ferredoxin [unclassified Gordonia (in: high G+C Gram-positive bacteria)]|uniref:ferredoxin n=1 Tax=unclassified Gordonia (in: high G+C Gram-positive bacteria) TaxID=2657482 RepID=UPI00200056FD|nr:MULTISPECIES: ferredoxin [unclassified Gordonia (in: high G+C Gram-positive bacteria)]UQE73637.1 ferredoxin [Gordonia sp. PP30]